MHQDAYKEKTLTDALVRVVNNRKAEGIPVDQILNESGITRSSGISVYHMVETRALVLYALGMNRHDTLLRQAVINFIADYPVFRWTELRCNIKSDPEQEIEAILHKLKYKSRMMEVDGEWEYIWSPRWLWTRTIIKRLGRQKRVGDTAFFKFLTYKPQR